VETGGKFEYPRCDTGTGLVRFLLWLLGVLLTALAATLGAPFWFDVLKKLINIRSAGIAPKQKKV
jgi:hypothetical protein